MRRFFLSDDPCSEALAYHLPVHGSGDVVIPDLIRDLYGVGLAQTL